MTKINERFDYECQETLQRKCAAKPKMVMHKRTRKAEKQTGKIKCKETMQVENERTHGK